MLSRLRSFSSIVCGWSLGISIVAEQDSAFVGVSWPLPSSLASGPLNILNAQFRL